MDSMFWGLTNADQNVPQGRVVYQKKVSRTYHAPSQCGEETIYEKTSVPVQQQLSNTSTSRRGTTTLLEHVGTLPNPDVEHVTVKRYIGEQYVGVTKSRSNTTTGGSTQRIRGIEPRAFAQLQSQSVPALLDNSRHEGTQPTTIQRRNVVPHVSSSDEHFDEMWTHLATQHLPKYRNR